jgi:hypothetical protein
MGLTMHYQIDARADWKYYAFVAFGIIDSRPRYPGRSAPKRLRPCSHGPTNAARRCAPTSRRPKRFFGRANLRNIRFGRLAQPKCAAGQLAPSPAEPPEQGRGEPERPAEHQ